MWCILSWTCFPKHMQWNLSHLILTFSALIVVSGYVHTSPFTHFTRQLFCAYMKRHPAQCEWWQHWTGNKLFTHLKHLTKAQCLYRLLNSWKSLDNCPAIFQTWKRYGKYRYLKSGITVKSLGVFSFQSYNECFVSDVGQILFSLAHSFAVHHEKRFILAFFKVSVDHDLFDNLESGKRSYCFGKKSGKSLELWI